MSRPIIPRPAIANPYPTMTVSTGKPRKISTACGACKQRKTKCSGGNPCDACATRNSECVYDSSADQRRKIANQRNVQDLAEAQVNLKKYRELLGGIIAIIRVGDMATTQDMAACIQSGVGLSQLAAHVRNARLEDPRIEATYARVDVDMQDLEHLPSSDQLLPQMGSHGPRESISSSGGDQYSTIELPPESQDQSP